MKEIIKIANLQYTYPDGSQALTGIDLTIFEGESVGLLGPNGAGKSTLLLHLNGILNGSGKVEIMGLEISKKNVDFIRRKVGLVFQDPEDQLFMPTVFDDVSFGPLNMGMPEEEVSRRVKEALRGVGLDGFERRVSHHLSFGEKKKASLATVISMGPEILALDEPTSNLDPRSRREFIRLIKDIKCTKIIASHDLDMIFETCDRTVVIDEGRIMSDGKAKEILSDEDLMNSHGLEIPPLLTMKRG